VELFGGWRAQVGAGNGKEEGSWRVKRIKLCHTHTHTHTHEV
jgi:hypothetical protein